MNLEVTKGQIIQKEMKQEEKLITIIVTILLEEKRNATKPSLQLLKRKLFYVSKETLRK